MKRKDVQPLSEKVLLNKISELFKPELGSLLYNFSIKDLPKFIIFIDTYDKNQYVYNFILVVDTKMFVLNSKVMRDEKEFKEEVTNIANYFNGKIVGKFNF